MSRWLQFGVILCAVLQIVFATAVVAKFSVDVFEKELKPAERQKAMVVNQLLADLVADMLAYGIPADRLRGMEKIFSRIQSKHPNITYLAIEDSQQRTLYERANTGSHNYIFHSVAETSNQPTGYQNLNVEQFASELKLTEAGYSESRPASVLVRTGIDRDYFANKQKEIYLDVLTVLVVSVLMAVELLVFLFVFTIRSPMKRLQTALQAVSNGKFSRIYEFKTADEVGRCGRLLNDIILRVNKSHFAPVSSKSTIKADEPTLASQRSSDSKMSTNGQESPADRQIEVGKPGKLRCGYDQALVYMRPPLFLVIFAESMSLSFFPGFVDQLYTSMNPLPVSKALVMGLPISIFMLVWALSLPFAGQWSDRVGRRKAFIFGSVLTATGLVLTSQSSDVYQLVFWRSLTALGYGIVFITAQSYVTDLTTPADRTKGMALFLSGFFSGSLCGAAIGGILADRIGFEATFIFSATLACGASFFAARFFIDYPQISQDKKTSAGSKLLEWQDVKKLFTNRCFITITFLAAIPAKAALTGFIYYIGPVYLSYLGASKSVSGRVLMAYGLAIVIISPLTALLIDRYQQQKTFIVVGGLLSSAALLVVGLTGDITGLGVGVLLLGVAHACSVSPQSSLITATVVQSSGVAVGKTIGIYRLTERIGNISGPLLAGALIAGWGFQSAFIAFSVFLAISSLLFLCFVRLEKPFINPAKRDFSVRGNRHTTATGSVS